MDTTWYPVALSHALENGTAAGTRIDGREIALWRDNESVAHAWEDRCPHRGVRLSLGFVRGNHIACLYHGWEYATDGQCRFIPAHPELDVPETIRVPRFAVAEHAGMIWTTGAADGDPQTLPRLDGPVTPLRSLYADARPDTLLAVIGTTGMVDIGATVWRLKYADQTLLIGVQPFSETITALHIVVAGKAPAERLIALARLAEGLRLEAERAQAAEGLAA